MRFTDISEGVAGPKKCWPGHRKVGTQPGTGKNAGKRVNKCEKIKNESALHQAVKEFAPSFGGGDDGNDGFSEETLKRLAAQWWKGDEDPRVERTLMAAGWEIGQDEGYDEGGVFVVQSGDVHGKSYISWPAKDLEGLGEGIGDEVNPADVGEYDQEGAMAIGQLKTAADAAAELRSILDADENLPEWVQAKITKAVDYLDTARDYMKSKEQGVAEGEFGIPDIPDFAQFYNKKGMLVGTSDHNGFHFSPEYYKILAQDFNRAQIDQMATKFQVAQKLKSGAWTVKQGVAEGWMSDDKPVSWEQGGTRTPTGALGAKGKVTRTKTGLIHRSTDQYGAGEDEDGRRKDPRDLEHLNKDLTARLDRSMGIKHAHGNKRLTDEAYDPWDEADVWYRYDATSGKLKRKSWRHAQERDARSQGWSQDIEQALRKANIIRSKFNPNKFVQKQGDKWVTVNPFAEPNKDASQ